jgi:SAM-dependent methyltransferase
MRDWLDYITARKKGSQYHNNHLELKGYPRNHNYRLRGKQLIPCFRLYRRWRIISSLYPQALESFLEVGSCKGFFVLDAASRPSCKYAVGIDIYKPFISIAKKVKDIIEKDNVAFHEASIFDVSESPEFFRGPFQTVLLINTYHYIFWGSSLSPIASYSHEKILSNLAKICIQNLIFSSPLELEECPKIVRERAEKKSGKKEIYTTQSFLTVAREFFHLQEKGFLGKRPLYLMTKK